MKTKLILVAFFVVLVGAGLPAQENKDRLTVQIAVAGPGDELYFWWGHIALVIKDDAKGTTNFYDWGVFSFQEENFFVDFAFGRLIYMCAVSPASRNYRRYTDTNRDIRVYTLNLPPETKAEILKIAEQNARPENRNYEYHHFYNNCSTRVRDILDIALLGQFKERYGDAPGRYTLRQHVRRHTWFSPFFDWILNFWMGQDIDKPIRIWDEMFLPSEVGKRIEEFSYIDSEGTSQKLVTKVETLNTAIKRPAVLEVPRRQWDRELLVGLLIAALMGVLRFLQSRKKKLWWRLFGLGQSILGLFFGGAGLVLFFMTFFTNHDYTYHNANVIYVNFILLVALPAGLVYAFCKSEKRRFISAVVLRCLWAYVFLGGLLTIVIKLAPAFFQQNQVTQALVLPFAFVLCFPMPKRAVFAKISRK
jgi:hypothetical protein